MKVAIVFNEAYPHITNEYQTSFPNDLGFKPNFDFEKYDPIAEYEQIAKFLRKSGHDAYILNILDNIDIFLNDFKKNKPDVVFNFVEIYKDLAQLEMSFASLLELFRVPYTGAPPMALGTCLDKTLTKRILSSVGIVTPKFKLVEKNQKSYRLGLKYPIIVKPAFEDASIGIENESIVSNPKDLKKRIQHVFEEYQQSALCEEYIDGRELNVAVFGDKNPEVLPISEITFSKMPKHLHNIVSYQAKWDPFHESYHKTIPKCPAKLKKKIRKEAEQIALKAAETIGVRDYSRVDMRLDKNDNLFVLEVNPNPDLTENAGFMRSAQQAGYSYKKALNKIVEFAAIRGIQ